MIPQENVISLFLSLISVAFNSEWETGKQAGVWFCVGLFQNIQHNSWSRKSPLNAINIGGCGLQCVSRHGRPNKWPSVLTWKCVYIYVCVCMQDPILLDVSFIHSLVSAANVGTQCDPLESICDPKSNAFHIYNQ